MLAYARRFADHTLFRYVFACLAAVAAFLLHQGLTAHVGQGLSTYITFYPAVMLVAVLGGLGPGIVTTALSAALTLHWLLPPRGAPAFESLQDAVSLTVFFVMGLGMSLLAETHRRSRQKAADYERGLVVLESEEALVKERANLQAIFDVANVGLLLVDANGTVKRVNHTLSRWVGRDFVQDEDLQPGDFVGCIHSVAGAAGCGNSSQCHSCRIRKALESTLRTGEPMHDLDVKSTFVVGGREARLWFEVSVDPLDLDGARHAILAMNDITERRTTEEALRESEERFRAVFEQAAIGIGQWDLDGRLLRSNGMLSAILGYTEEELKAKTFLEITHPDDLPVELEQMDALLAGRIPSYTCQKRYLHKDGREIWVRITSSLARGIQEPYRISIVEDITARIEAENEVQRTAQELARSNQDLEQFAYVASHDLQEPLRMVAGYLQLLAERYRGQLDEKADKYINYAVDGAERMSILIRDLLEYSRVNTRGEPLRPTDAHESLDFALRNLRSRIEQNEAEVTFDTLPRVNADKIQLARLFQNLIGNAIKFRGDGRRPRIHLSVESQQDQWLFSVADNGIGFEQQYTDRIFLIFQRLHGRAQYPGTGVGLAVCKRIVERHGGRIWACGEPDKGAIFSFTIPKQSN